MTHRNQHYPPELRGRTVRGDPEVRLAVGRDRRSRAEARVGTAETVRKWVRQAEVDSGQRPGTATDESAESSDSSAGSPSCAGPTKSSRRPSVFFVAELNRPSHRS